jgi:streptomycin 6-kinase
VIPQAVRDRLLGAFGPRAEAWVQSLPSRLERFARRWELELEPPFAAPSQSYAAPGLRAGEPVVLKLALPGEELACEVEALRLFEGRGAVRLLDADPGQGALLLERLLPGTPLARLEEEELVEVAATVMRRLWRPVPDAHGFPTLERWAEVFARLRLRGPALAAPLLARGPALFRELCASAPRGAVLHGDLHHWNVLRAQREPWLAIDPKGVVGDPAYEVGALLRNAVELSSDPERCLAHGVERLGSALGVGRDRLLRWTLAHALLSAAWSIEDRTADEASALRCAGLAEALLSARRGR